MKLILLFALSLFGFNLFGQFTLTRSNYTHVGDTIMIHSASGTLPVYQTSGSNQVWDFSTLNVGEKTEEITYSLNAGGMIVNFQFGPFAPSKYQADIIQEYDGIPFDLINEFIPMDVPIEGINRIIKTNDEKVEIVGYSIKASGQQLGFRSDSIEVMYAFPTNYLDTHSTFGYTEFNLNPIIDIQLNQHRERTTIVDGYGTIATPHHVYKDVIRIIHKTIENNQVKVPIGGQPIWIPIQRNITEYEWWSTKFKRPVFKIEEENVFGFPTTTRITFIHDPQPPYHYLSTGLYPNPSKDFTVLKLEEAMNQVLVYNLEGKLVREISVSPAQDYCEIDLKNLRSGRYTVIAITEKNKHSFPLIVL